MIEKQAQQKDKLRLEPALRKESLIQPQQYKAEYCGQCCTYRHYYE